MSKEAKFDRIITLYVEGEYTLALKFAYNISIDLNDLIAYTDSKSLLNALILSSNKTNDFARSNKWCDLQLKYFLWKKDTPFDDIQLVYKSKLYNWAELKNWEAYVAEGKKYIAFGGNIRSSLDHYFSVRCYLVYDKVKKPFKYMVTAAYIGNFIYSIFIARNYVHYILLALVILLYLDLPKLRNGLRHRLVYIAKSMVLRIFMVRHETISDPEFAARLGIPPYQVKLSQEGMD